jgi:hypothetical protein
MTYQVTSITGCLAVTAAAKPEMEASHVGNITVRLSFDTQVVAPASNGTAEREAEKALVALELAKQNGSAAAAGSRNVTLDLTVQQAFQLLSELEDMQVSLISADR